MTQPVLDWLRHLARAVSASQLYPADHPRVVSAVQVLYDLTLRLLADRPETSLFMVEGRLTWNGDLVPGGDGVAGRAFELLQAKGRDRITFRKGIEPTELDRLLTGLAAKDPVELQATPHVRFSVLEAGRPKPVAAAPLATSDLTSLWKQIETDHTLDSEALDRLLQPLARVAEASDGRLPLSTLRHHDEYTATHIANVAVLTIALARRIGLPAGVVQEIGVAALLHDIGKVRVPPEVLNHPGALSQAQLALIRRHPDVGARMLLQVPTVPRLAVIVAYEHHLQADGGGYPEVPRGWVIHRASALTHVADVYDALRTHRPYRRARTHDQIVELMWRDRGTVFPEGLLQVFLDEVAPMVDTGADPPVPLPSSELGAAAS